MGHNMVFILRHNKINRDFDCHTDAAVQCGVHRLMEHIPGFTRSHCMPPLGDCLRCIAPMANMVDKFVAKHKTPTKTIFS